MNVTLRQLEHALALQRQGTFCRAAREAHISQPAFSRSIRNLEAALGATLFDRSGPRVVPTVFGEAMLRRAAEILAQTAEIGRDLGMLAGLGTGYLTVAVAVHPAELSGARALGELITRYPGIRCKATLTNWRAVGEMVLSRRADVGLADVGQVLTNPQFDVQRVGQHEVLFYCRRGHPLLRRRRLTIADLVAYPAVSMRIPARQEPFLAGWLARDELTGDLLPHVEVDELSTARAVVGSSDGLSFAAPLQIEAALRAGELCLLPFRPPWLRLDYGFINLRGRLLPPAVALFMEIVREVEAEVAARNRALIGEFLPGATDSGAA